MIPVKRQDEPAGFEIEVRRKGLRWLRDNGISPDGPVPKGVTLPAYWRACLPELYDAYGCICAYLCVRMEIAGGGVTTEHFIAKSLDAGQAYEWGNYRLACSQVNSRKGVHQDVLDPFEIRADMFHLECITGRIYPNPALPPQETLLVERTIERLDLDNEMNREMRRRHFDECIHRHIDGDYLKRISPFVWSEADRQNLL